MDIVNFTPVSAVIGGAIIGLSAAFLLLVKGRIAGISGIAGGIILPEKGDLAWRIFFVIGLILGGLIYQWLDLGPELREIKSLVGTSTLIIAGLLVGIGTTVGTGCTSGHGICGLARRSPRSLVATLTFMGSAILTVFIVRHLIG